MSWGCNVMYKSVGNSTGGSCLEMGTEQTYRTTRGWLLFGHGNEANLRGCRMSHGEAMSCTTLLKISPVALLWRWGWFPEQCKPMCTCKHAVAQDLSWGCNVMYSSIGNSTGGRDEGEANISKMPPVAL